FFVRAKSPFVSLLKHSEKVVNKLNTKSSTVVRLIGLNKAIPKTISLGLRYQQKGFVIDIHTGTKHVIDEDVRGGIRKSQPRHLSTVTVFIRKSENPRPVR
ncbi:hypothetical protein V1514DRAFT_274924, partial [Lipomyces japonicus]|uniref:uncharacterized protein n=1 Tax=Lipomyces japonicus TaxID=56871 RepID=UPI0034CEDB72